MLKLVREPEHRPTADPCGRCGLKASRHRRRVGRKASVGRREQRAAAKEVKLVVAIDGEGRGRDPHVYTYLSAVDEHGHKLSSVENQSGLSTVECLDFLLDLHAPLLFGFSIGYDLAMWLRDMPDAALYRLAHEKERERVHPDSGRRYHQAVYWRNYKLTLMRKRFSVQRTKWDGKKNVPVGQAVVIWDVFQFYQARFTKALADWKAAPKDVIAKIQEMKDKRDDFDRLAPHKIQAYCDDECKQLAGLVRQLLEACTDAQLELRGYGGAGYVASAMLRRLEVKQYMADPPPEMSRALWQGFFGGRFEVSRVGPIRQPCFGHDISSAYPYQMATSLPCLACGRWRFVSGRDTDQAVRGAQMALVCCEVRRSGPTSWGPLPFRLKDGTIVFPLSCGATWVWRDEYVAARDTLWPGVRAASAWIYETKCDHRPFAGLPALYTERLRLGKDGPGIILKLGYNAGYGKLAQSEGDAPFRSWAWAGQITSGTRAQLLRAIAASKNPANVVMLATDGVFATERLRLPPPIETGTGNVPDRDTGKCKPLGGWEIKSEELRGGMFIARPGIYFPLGRRSEDKIKEMRARGISRSVLVQHASRIVRHFRERGPWRPYQVKEFTRKGKVVDPCVRFVGLRQGIRLGAGQDPDAPAHQHRFVEGYCTVCDVEVVREATAYDDAGNVCAGFGCWVNHEMVVSFAPGPKRERVTRGNRLTTWVQMPGESAPYDKAKLCEEARLLREAELELSDSPDGDVCLR